MYALSRLKAPEVAPSENLSGTQANKKAFQALDNAFRRGAHIAFSQFIRSQPVQPLTVTQRRSFPKVPHPVTGEFEPRAVISDSADGSHRYELDLVYKNGVRLNLSIHTVHDLGSVGFPMAWWFFWQS